MKTTLSRNTKELMVYKIMDEELRWMNEEEPRKMLAMVRKLRMMFDACNVCNCSRDCLLISQIYGLGSLHDRILSICKIEFEDSDPPGNRDEIGLYDIFLGVDFWIYFLWGDIDGIYSRDCVSGKLPVCGDSMVQEKSLIESGYSDSDKDRFNRHA